MVSGSHEARRRTLSRARYRAGQFVRGLRPHLAPAEIAEVRALLNEREFALFLGTEPRDRRHSVDLLHRLRQEAAEAGQPVPRELLVAAAVHDVGKGPLRAWHRVVFVLLSGVAPRLSARLEAQRGAGWRQALWRLRHHARLGAELLEGAGSNPRIVRVVAAHTEAPPPDDEEIRRFIAADDRV